MHRIAPEGTLGWLRRGGLLIVTVLVVEYFVLPKVIDARADLSLLSSADERLLAVALLLEGASLLSYSALTRTVLRAEHRPHYWTLLRIDITGLGVSHVVPGGGATAAALRFRLLTRAGVSSEEAVASTTIQTAVSVLLLVVVFTSGLVVALPQLGSHPLLLVTGVILIAVVAIAVGVAALLMRYRDGTLRAARAIAARIPVLRADAVVRLLRTLAARAHAIVLDRRLLVRTATWACGNWVLDAACLWVCLRAYGYSAGVGQVMAAYGLVNLLALLPITPGGIGVVEGVLVPALVSFGAAQAVALLGVLTWRLAEYWLPLPLSLLAYVSLRLSRLVDRGSADTAAP